MADITPNVTPKVNPVLNAIPGETSQQYEVRLGGMKAGVGTGFNNPTTSSPTPYGVNDAGQPLTQKSAAQIQAEADTLHAQPIADNSAGTRSSSKIESNFQTYLDKLGARPTPPDSNTVQTNAENQVGLSGIQSNLKNLTDQRTALENDLQNRQAGEASKPGVVATIVNGRMRMLSATDSKALNDLKAQISSASTDYKNANTAVQSIMKNTQTDYTNASKAYDDVYTKAYQAFTASESRLSKEQASASANAKVIISSFKGSSAGINSITPEEETQWNNLEMQAELPTGFIKAAVQAELNVDKWVKGTDGNMYVYTFGPDGNPVIAKAGSVGGVQPKTKKPIADFNFTPKQLVTLQTKGLNQSDAQGILTDIKTGHTLEEIRQNMKTNKIDPGLLDSMMYIIDPKNNTPS